MIIDLTYPICSGMFKYPSDPPAEVGVIKAKLEEGRYKSGFTTLNIRNHHGTHIDAPSHKIPGGRTIDQYPISKFSDKPAIIIDLTGVLEYRTEIPRSCIEEGIAECKKNFGNTIAAVLFYTGFSDKMLSKQGVREDKFPYFSIGAAALIAEQFPSLDILGIDSFSVDGRGSNSEVHRLFFDRDILPLETLINLNTLSKFAGNRMFRLFCLPISYSGADASQVRAYAVLDSQ